MPRVVALVLLLFVVDLLVLMKLGQWLGASNAVLYLAVTAIVGVGVTRSVGLRLMSCWREAMQGNRVPEEAFLAQWGRLAAGVLLIVPGVLSDVAGALLLIPSVRRALMVRIRHRMSLRVHGAVVTSDAPPERFRVGRPQENVTDAELVEDSSAQTRLESTESS